MSSLAVTEMFPTISGDVELPKTFINSLRILFDILDEDKDGFVPVAEIEKRWQGDGISGLPNGVLQSLRKVAPENGFLNFDLFCSALKLTLKTNKERSRIKEHRQPNKAAVKPNNVHPMRSHQIQSAPHLRRNPGFGANTENDTMEDRLKSRVTSPHLQANSVSANGSIEAMKDQLKHRVTSPHLRINSVNAIDNIEIMMEDRLGPKSPPAHLRINSITASYERMEENPKPNVKSPTPMKMKPSAEPKSPPPQVKISPHIIERISSPRPKSNHVRLSYPPAYTYPHRRPTHVESHTSTTTRSPSTNYEEHLTKHFSNYASTARVGARPMVRSPKPTWTHSHIEKSMPLSSLGTRAIPSSSFTTCTSPTEKQNQFTTSVVKSPPPYMAHVKPQSHKVVKAQLVYPQSNTNQNRSSSGPPPPHESYNPPKRTNRRKKEEPRRHTLANGISTDFNALKRMKDLEQERDVLHQGLDLLEKCRNWYQDELLGIKEQQHRLISGKEINRGSRQDRVVYRTTRIMEINRQMRALMNSTEAFPDHMNLAMPERSALPEKSPLVNKLKDQNKKLTQEVSFKSDRITSLEKEKSTLIRQLFEVRSRPRSRGRSENTTLL